MFPPPKAEEGLSSQFQQIDRNNGFGYNNGYNGGAVNDETNDEKKKGKKKENKPHPLRFLVTHELVCFHPEEQ